MSGGAGAGCTVTFVNIHYATMELTDLRSGK